MSGADAGGVRSLLLSNRGEVIYDRQVSLPPVFIPSRVADSVVGAYEKRAREQSDPASAKTTRRAAYVSDVYPPAVDAVLGEDGRLWIRGRLRDQGYWVLDAAGHLAGRAVLPGNAEIFVADSTHDWAVELDQRDVSSISRYRILQTQEFQTPQDK